ncbi:hypothetical protein [Luteibacter sp. UNC138MFCol5.1]|uniref:hypothetical protein n=1 Tax=Luteibacter sp. UNC138MFCol5.1 TaxID=1502774 RepID=UPI0015A71FE5|nr:hypothetical protein [Luteibacter sp. UNC138MFCol5.1]
MRAERGAILVVVLAMLAMLSIVAAALAESARARLLAAHAFVRAERCAAGRPGDGHATIGNDATGASSIEGTHGSQTFPPGGDDRLRHGADRAGHRQGRGAGCDG